MGSEMCIRDRMCSIVMAKISRTGGGSSTIATEELPNINYCIVETPFAFYDIFALPMKVHSANKAHNV